MRSASTTERWRTVVRPIAPKRNSRWRILPSREATAKCTRPTGLPGVAPPGPAMPVIDDREIDAGFFQRADRHRGRGFLADRAEGRKRRGLDAEHRALGVVGIGDEAAVDHVGGAGNIGERAGDQAAGAGLRRWQSSACASGTDQAASGRGRGRRCRSWLTRSNLYRPTAGGWWRSRSRRCLPRGR